MGPERKENRVIQPKNHKRRILVVEPDRDFCPVLCDFLATQKFEVTSAASGDEGLQRAGTFHPDIILLSRELPMNDGTLGPDGLRVLKLLKQDRGLSRIPVIMFSGEAGDKDFDRYRKLKFSAEDYLLKPFEDSEVIRRIENLVGFDLSEDLEDIKNKVRDVMDDPLANIFNADPEELGYESTATRKEVSNLLEQVGLELDRAEPGLDQDEQEPAAEIQGWPTSPEPVEEAPLKEKLEQIHRLSQQVQDLNRQLDRVQKQLVSERKRSREIKKEWKQNLQSIAERLKTSADREARIRKQFEAIRAQTADLELEHTMELERANAEKRRLEEEIAALREQTQDSSDRADLAQDLAKVAKALQAIIARLENNH